MFTYFVRIQTEQLNEVQDPQALAVNAFHLHGKTLSFMLPAFQRHHTSAWQNSAGESDRGGGGAALANTGLGGSSSVAPSRACL